jgi:protein-tyrosine phosphatase
VTEKEVVSSILFVCMGNICRSPTAEAVFREIARREAADIEFRVDSAGTHGYHVGEPPDRRAIMAARRRGYAMEHLRARQVEPVDFERFELLLAMDADNLAVLHRIAPAGHRERARLLLEFAPGVGRREVPDPYYGGEAGFEEVLDLVEEAARGLLEALRRR